MNLDPRVDHLDEDDTRLVCTECAAVTDTTAEQLAEMGAKVRGWRKRLKFINALCETWRCGDCLARAGF